MRNLAGADELVDEALRDVEDHRDFADRHRGLPAQHQFFERHDQADGNKAVRAKAIVTRALFSDKLSFVTCATIQDEFFGGGLVAVKPVRAAKTGTPCERCTVRETCNNPVFMDFA
jgi:hypothetical protein